VAGLMSWFMIDQRVDAGIAGGLLLGALACWLNAWASGRQRRGAQAGDQQDDGPQPAQDHAGDGTPLAACSATDPR
jgi:hypothetical protein